MAKYKAPDPEAAAFLSQESYRPIAAELGESGQELGRSLARHYVAKASASLRSLQRQGRGQSTEARELKQERTRLIEEPAAVFLHVQQIIDDRFGQLTESFETWLTDNPPALAMLDRDHLLALVSGTADSETWPTWRLFAEAARQMQVVSLFGTGFSASAPEGGARVLEIGAGIYDGISTASSTIVGATVRFT